MAYFKFCSLRLYKQPVCLFPFQKVDLLLDSDQIVQALGNKRSKRYFSFSYFLPIKNISVNTSWDICQISKTLHLISQNNSLFQYYSRASKVVFNSHVTPINQLVLKVHCRDFSVRYSMLVEDGLVKKVYVEPDGTGLSCSLAPNILSELQHQSSQRGFLFKLH